jgi:HK97 family phage portal protein
MALQTGIFSDVLALERSTALAKRKTEVIEPEVVTREFIERAVMELRTSLENPATPLSYPAEWLLDIFNGGRTDSGIRVSELTALQVSDVYACVDLISSAIAAQPIKIFERIEVGEQFRRHAKRLATEHPLFDLLAIAPNNEMTGFMFVKTLMAHALLWGNAYAEIERNGAGVAVGLWPRSPQRTRPVRITATSRLKYKTSDGIWEPWQSVDQSNAVPERVIQPEDMLFIPGLSLDGRIGQDVVELARQIVGLALATEKSAAKYFGNGARPLGILTTPAKLTKVQEEGLRRSIQEAYGGENVFRTMLLQGGVEYKRIQDTPSEAQMIDARKWNKIQISSIFHVPPTMLGLPGANRASAEQVALEFVNYTLKPWVTRWEQELVSKLLQSPKYGRNANKSFIAIIDTRELMLPDAKSKQAYYTSMRQWSWGNANDVREIEDLNPLEGKLGEAYLVPVNMTVVDADGKVLLAAQTKGNQPGQPAKPQPGAAQAQTQPSNTTEIVKEGIWPLFRDAFGRAITRKERDYRTIERIFAPILASLDKLSGKSRLDLRTELGGLTDDAQGWTAELAETQARAELARLIELRTIKPKRDFYIARHAQTANDSEGKSDDFHPEEPLNEAGEFEAQTLAQYVKDNLTLEAIYCGTPKRHVQTSQAISKLNGNIPITESAALNSKAGEESDSEFHARIIKELNSIKTAAQGNVLVITSHKAIDTYLKELRGQEQESKSSDIDFAALYQLTADEKDALLIFNPGALGCALQ